MKKSFLLLILCTVSLVSCHVGQDKTSIFSENYEEKVEMINNIFSLSENYVISEIIVSNSMRKYKKINRYEVAPLTNKTILKEAKNILYIGQRNWNSNNMLYRIIAIEFNTIEAANVIKENNPWMLNYTDDNIAYQNTYAYYIMSNQIEKDGVFLLSKDKKTLLTTTIKTPTLILPDVETIGSQAFFARTDVKEVYFGKNTKAIGFYAFAGCWYMNTIKLNDGLKQIDNMAFYSCESLKSLIIPQSVETVGNEIFDNGTIYCEATEKPSGWDNNFYGENTTVYWGNQWYYNENNIPQIK